MQSTSILARSCAACRRRKIRCDRNRPKCGYCRKQNLDCSWPIPRPRSSRDDSPYNNESSVKSPRRRAAELSVNASRKGPTESPNDHTTPAAEPFWAQVNAEARRSQATSSYEDYNDDHGEIEAGPGQDAAATMMLFQSDSPPLDLQHCHPSPAVAFGLWQKFVDTVDPLLKIVHTPIVQSRFLQATMKPDEIEPSFEALMFAIYYAATISSWAVKPREDISSQQRSTELAKFRWALNHSLIQAGFFQRSRDLVSLQAFVIYLICARFDNSSPCVWTLVSLAIRVGMRLGLHHEQSVGARSPFETEMRRRLWWQICTLDTRSAEDEGTWPLISQAMLQTPLPRNIADVDLHAEMSQAPTASKGCTAMLYNNARIETTQGLRNILFVDDQAEKPSSLQTKMEAIDILERRLQSEYFDHCDLSISLCNFTVTTIRLVFLKSRLTLHISHSNRPAEWCSEVDDFLFRTSVDILERTHVLISNPQYERWWWLFRTYVEWDALALSLRGLCRSSNRPNADRAWTAIERAWTYAETLAAGSSHNKRWTSLCRLKGKAMATRTQVQSTGETQVPGQNDTLQNLQTCEVTDMITAAPTSNTLAFDELEPYGSMSAYWNLLDEGWGMVSEGAL